MTVTGRRGRGRRTGDKKITETEILDAAIELFASRGFMTTSIQNIADRLGVSQSAVMYYFPSRPKLFVGCISLIQGRNRQVVEQAMRPEDNARARLVKHFRANLKWAVDAPHEAQIILLLYSMAAFDPEFSALNLAVLRAAREKILVFVLAGQREGLFGKAVRVPQAVELLHDNLLAGILNWVTTRKVLKDKKAHLDALTKKWDAFIDQTLEVR